MTVTFEAQRVRTRRGNELSVLTVPAVIDGPGRAPLLLLHPINMRKECWLGVLPALAAERACVLVDLSGHGESTDDAAFSLEAWVEDCLDVLDALGLGSIHLAGGSLGGAIALGVAASWPGAVLSVAGFGSTVEAVPPEVAEPPAPSTPGEVDELFAQLAREAVGPTVSDGVVDTIRHFTNRHGADVVTRILRAAFAADATRWVEDVDRPALWVVGEHDFTCTAPVNAQIARGLGGREVVLPGLGHLLMIEAPALVAELLVPHLRDSDHANPGR